MARILADMDGCGCWPRARDRCPRI